ncbi:MAG: DUF3843 family protein [Candidatus Azobacteroides sp.]|nr:DUF3843 family protein [Candidatus Azobacteroides sp.]
MKSFNQTNRVVGKDWLQYHPYNNFTLVDNYYMKLCNTVLKIIQTSEIVDFLDDPKEGKELACVLTAYFEDVISETRLFSTFTHLHKKMYGKELPFYEIPDDYYDDEINLRDLYFLIWYQISVHSKDIIIDPYFENDQAFNEAASKIYYLFDSEFEKAPQNEHLQNFLQLSADSKVGTVREKLSFIACESFLWKAFFDDYFADVLDRYQVNSTIVLDNQKEVEIYDSRVHFIFNNCMPLLTLRANEYLAEVLGEKHSEYSFIKNISKRIMGCFLIRKIEKDGFLIEHLSSKKQLWLSNEFTSFKNVKLVENETVLTICLVKWKGDVWQNQGLCLVESIKGREGKDISEHLFEDENEKKKFIANLEKAFLALSKGERMVYIRGNREYAQFQFDLTVKHAKITDPKLTDKELNEKYQNFSEDDIKNIPFEDDEAIGIFFNPNGGIEIYRESVISCMPDKNNPYYAHEEFDLCELLTNSIFSKEFLNYAIGNDKIKFCIDDYENPDMFRIVMENFDFLLRFYRQSDYFSERTAIIE